MGETFSTASVGGGYGVGLHLGKDVETVWDPTAAFFEGFMEFSARLRFYETAVGDSGVVEVPGWALSVSPTVTVVRGVCNNTAVGSGVVVFFFSM